MNVGTILLCIYAAAIIGLGAYGHVKAAIAVGILGFLLLLIYSLCWVAGEADQWDEDHRGIRRS